MNAPLVRAVFASLVVLAPVAASAVEAEEVPVSGRQSEPKIQRLVTEDDATRIEELRVRGQTQSITVTPKKGAIQKPYEILPANDGRDMSYNGQATRGAAGKSVWRVLNF
jgi:hypothetical protein